VVILFFNQKRTPSFNRAKNRPFFASFFPVFPNFSDFLPIFTIFSSFSRKTCAFDANFTPQKHALILRTTPCAFNANSPFFRHFSDQQFSTGGINNLSALQIALADRTFLQVDQTALANKIVFRNFYQRSQDPSLDCDQCLCACGDNQNSTYNGTALIFLSKFLVTK